MSEAEESTSSEREWIAFVGERKIVDEALEFIKLHNQVLMAGDERNREKADKAWKKKQKAMGFLLLSLFIHFKECHPRALEIIMGTLNNSEINLER